jgi:uncharacterized protein (DUF362 family)
MLMSNITRKYFLNLSFSALAGIVLTSLTACLSKINSVDIIKEPTQSGISGTGITNNSVDNESIGSTGTQPQNETGSSTSTTAVTNTGTTQTNTTEKKAVIGITSGEEKISILVGKAIELAGGLSFINKGSTVLIKPNLNTGDPHPASTNPEVVYEVINLVKKQNPYRILVGDRSGYWLDTIDCMKKSKIYDAAVSAGAEVYPFDDEEWIQVNPVKAQNWPDGYRIPKIVNDADYIISIPVLKTHSIANFSIAIKNWVGILYPKDRTSGLHPYNNDKIIFGSKLAELHLSRPPSFIITDCTKVFVNGGPTNGKDVDGNMIFATNDLIANDVMGLAILKTLGTMDIIQDNSPWIHPQIKRAIELGLGIKNCQKMEINPYNVVNIDSIFKNIC